jgi:LmbE family N-acetylglucosaminyl deacetylase
MSNIVVVAPHPDDETLGCGGTLLRHIDQGDSVYWVLVTQMNLDDGYSQNHIDLRAGEIKKIADEFGFISTLKLGFPTTRLDTIPLSNIVKSIGDVFTIIHPDIVYFPYRGDVHTDHAIVFDATVSCTKWFRYPSIKRVLAYETVSETAFGINPDANGFRPNVFVDISSYIDQKIEMFKIYADEWNNFPFPRSETTIRALAALHGATAGVFAAEAFMLLKEVI